MPEIAGFRWFALYLLLHIPSLPVEIYYLLLKKPYHLLLWGILGWGLYLPVVIIPAWMGWGTNGALQGLCLLAAFKLIWALRLLQQYGQFVWLSQKMRQYLRLSAPMVANSFVGNLILFFDTWLVAHWYTDAAVFAIFRYGSREFPLALALATALGTALIPQVSAGLGAGLEEIRVRGTRLLHTIMPLTILLMIGAPWYFPLVFNPDFSEAAPLFQIGLLVTLSRVLLPNSILIGLGETRILFFVGIAELVIKVLTGILFIYWWGLPGVMWSVVVSYWFEKAALAGYLYRNRGIRLSEWLDLKVYGFYFLVLLLVYLLSSLL
jgi:O-antigen/teichoic acid export membrane protein